jgi:hypothetical protein
VLSISRICTPVAGNGDSRQIAEKLFRRLYIKPITLFSTVVGWFNWLFTVLCPAQEFFTYMETSPLPEKSSMLGAQGLWAGGIFIVPHLHAVTRNLVFFGLIRRTAPFSRLLRYIRGCGESILTRILTGPFVTHSLQTVNSSSRHGSRNFLALAFCVVEHNHVLPENHQAH